MFQINEAFHVCPLQFSFPQTAPRGALEGYLYPATFRRVLMDYQKALISSAGWGLTVMLALNVKVLKWFVQHFFLIKKHRGGTVPSKNALKTPEQQPNDTEAGVRCQKCGGSSPQTRYCAVCVGIWADRQGRTPERPRLCWCPSWHITADQEEPLWVAAKPVILMSSDGQDPPTHTHTHTNTHKQQCNSMTRLPFG